MNALNQYLYQTNWLATVQFVIDLAVLHRLLDRSLSAVGVIGRFLPPQQRVADPVLDALARLCLGMGLLLTFSGLFGYISSCSGRDSVTLLLTLGSSAWGAIARGRFVRSVRSAGRRSVGRRIYCWSSCRVWR